MLTLRRLKWSARRLTVPVDAKALVLEVGSGGNPYPRANVLVDAYEHTQERHWDPLVHDRPTVLAAGEQLPFKDKAFDFVIAAHVLEHTPSPDRFLAELERVAHAGYIETPDAFMERINPYKDHRLEVTVRDDTLVIRKKPRWDADPELVELYEQAAKLPITKHLIPEFPAAFHTRYYWKDKINYRILNPEIDASWKAMISAPLFPPAPLDRAKSSLRRFFLTACRWLFSQRGRNRTIDLLALLRCPACAGSQFTRTSDAAICRACGISYRYRQSVLVINEDTNE